MKSLLNAFAACLIFVSSTHAFSLPSRILSRDQSTRPTPTRPFTVAAFQSPFPPGNGSVTGTIMSAKDGSFWINAQDNKPTTGCGDLKGRKCPPGKETVLWVDKLGQAWLDSDNPQQVYLNTKTGILSYVTKSAPLADGALLTNFLHLGQGDQVTQPIPNNPGFFNAGPATFNWLGSDNNYWFLCPRPGPGYQVMKFVGGVENWSICTVVQLIALDYKGVSPAAGVYL